MGLKYSDLDSWRRWQQSRRRLHVLKDRARSLRRSPAPQPARRFWVRGADPTILVACDSDSPTNDHALIKPLETATDLGAVVAHPEGVHLKLGGEWTELGSIDEVWPSVRAVASIGDHLGTGAWAHGLAQREQRGQLVVQHGLLTPFSPPPPRNSRVAVWSEEDASFLGQGRPDLSFVVTGSPLLEAAASAPARHVSRFETPVFLGQLHGAELSRRSMARSVTAFWRETGCWYRPHPREEDKLSRLQHAAWRRAGMQFDDAARLSDVDRPVVSAFSTGVLEAAARGIPAWVFHLDPPQWLEEFWERYAMSRWGMTPTPQSPLTSIGGVSASTRIAHLFEGERP
ncbi:RNA-binding protein [Tessaracoccus sp. MC1627]|uniref:RNA-binding protein n=1 Tax=Tessaracoccus sp. MC1627 TaxID=2760312 RepID=UPI001600E9B5|nr:RNA-binding protein [Tessaracoccus sp. MC1627]MBB1513191.1 RNA-binding protein [Tessaracoccus sp. MC1627]MBB1513476.1 RNA-binding protein [Tessaracoccus sp. MC1627]